MKYFSSHTFSLPGIEKHSAICETDSVFRVSLHVRVIRPTELFSATVSFSELVQARLEWRRENDCRMVKLLECSWKENIGF